MNKKLSMKLSMLVASIVLLTIPIISLADVDVGNREYFPQPGAGEQYSAREFVNNGINYVIWPIAVGTVIGLFMLAGMQFLTGHGEPAKMQEARRSVAWGMVGVIVILLSFSIISTVQWLFDLV